MSFQGPPTANDAESRASADPSDAVAHQSNFEILKHPRAFLLEEAPLDRSGPPTAPRVDCSLRRAAERASAKAHQVGGTP